jgi:hypothetical protein
MMMVVIGVGCSRVVVRMRLIFFSALVRSIRVVGCCIYMVMLRTTIGISIIRRAGSHADSVVVVVNRHGSACRVHTS